MKSVALFSTILLLCLAHSARAQEYSYTHYDITDGLAGSVVYCITQDRDGFIWAGTETGVSRFDGTHFKTFTPADGLPDIEVLKMFADSKGRVWMAPFKTSVCYYYQGNIHNQDNDTLLARIHLKENVVGFAEDTVGNILILENNALHWFGADGSIAQIDSIDGRPVRNGLALSCNASGQFMVEADGSVYTLTGKNFRSMYSFHIRTQLPLFLSMNPSGLIWRDDTTTARIHSFVTGRTIALPIAWRASKHLSFGGLGDSLYYFNEATGTKEYNPRTGTTKVYLPGKAVSSVFRDAGGNSWFTTLGSGIYRLNSDEFRSIRTKESGLYESGVYSIMRMGDLLLAGTGTNSVFAYSLPDLRACPKNDIMADKARNRILAMQSLNENTVLMGTDSYLGTGRLGEPFSWDPIIITGIKSVFRKNAREFLLSTSWGVAVYDMSKLRITDTLWKERTTTVYLQNDTVYIGTLNGLYRLGPDRKAVFMGKDSRFFTKRISSIAESTDHTLWIASYDAGLVGYRDGAIVAMIGKRMGLSSDVCRTIFVHKNVLWVGTDKGLNKIALDKKGYPIIRYTSNDGLGSDMINCIFADGDVVYVGTPTGFSFFDQTKVDVSQKCRLHLLSIMNSGEDRIGDSANLRIPYRDKHVRFEFAAISYRSVGEITYRYRMLGLDSTWQETKETFLEYPILPSGTYVLQLQAINKFGIKSGLLSLPVEVATPWWQTLWFKALLIAAVLGIAWFLATLRIKRIHRHQQEKERLDQRMAELENTALQAQMNPHFIFNCLNSIQQYIFDHDIAATNKYLTGFARLIRATLQNSSQTFIPLTDEIDYLSTYLSLEKLRFKDRMEYTVDVDPAIEREIFVIPPMLIQPFVENSMRHGLRHKTDGQGYIHLRFAMVGDKLLVTVEDNGIGRTKAAAYKTREHIEYQSKGMSLTADRIRMMNTKFADGITIEVHDLKAGEGLPSGTRVTLHFPLFHILMTQSEVL